MRRVGNIERVCIDGDSVRLTGWSCAEAVRFSWVGGTRQVRPDRPRPDARRSVGGPSNDLGFEVSLPQASGPIEVSVRLPSGRIRHVSVQHPSAPKSARTRRRMRRAFCRDMIRALPAFAAYALHRGDAQKLAIKAALGLTGGVSVPALDAAWFDDVPSVPAPPPFTVIMPVHNGYDLLRQALDRVARNTKGDWRIVLVDDASPDVRVGTFLRDWCAAQGDRADLITLKRNLGFVAAVNRGLAIAEGRPGPIVLLNSDALVPPDWAGRLLAPLADTTVASVTPFSNDAEIFSVPLAAKAVEMTAALSDRIDLTARALGAPAELPSAPTGVGFCMALSRSWLTRVPRLDPAFGRGYGEEVDWCQRVRALGGRHVGQPRLFVYHAGGSSFGAEKAARLASANARISARYPDYDADVQRCINADPWRTSRLALAMAWAGLTVKGRLPVYLAHSLGGGADLALERDIARDLNSVGAALVLRVGGTSRFVMELRLPTGRLDGATASFDVIRAMLASVPRLRIVYSCGVGDPDASALPQLLLQLRRDVLQDRCEARLHDFFPISPSYCLLGRGGRYRGPVSRQCTEVAHQCRTSTGRVIPLADWQRGWHGFLAACDEITAYSSSSAAIFRAAYPSLSHRVAVREPAEVPLPPRVVPSPRVRSLGILGNLNVQKGSEVIAALAKSLDAAGDTRAIVVVGNVDAGCAMPARVRIHGGYRREDIPTLTHHYGISTWIVPAVWPETYSFSTREALATGLPVIAFDLGAQGEAVGRALNGVTLPYDPDADLATLIHGALPLTDGARGAASPAHRAPMRRVVAS
jgi:GT2 family glycosyltransferase